MYSEYSTGSISMILSKIKVINIFRYLMMAVFLYSLYLALLFTKSNPKYTYQINTYVPNSEVREHPLEISINPENNSIAFSVVFTDDNGNTEGANINIKRIIISRPPYLSYNGDMTLQLINVDNEVEEGFLIYEISGTISNLKAGEYKLKVIDPNGNLVDQDTFTL